MMDRLYIIACHKNVEAEKLDNPYVEICNSSAVNKPNGFEFYDDSYKENISKKNLAYCELSQLYSIWRNDFNYKMIGLGHYRRILNLNPSVDPGQFSLESFSRRKNTADNIEKHMGVFDNTFFVSTPFNVGSVLEQFDIFHPQLSDLFRHSFSVFQKQNPSAPNAEQFFRTNGALSTCNTFYGSRDLVDRFCNQVFNLLFEIEKDVPSDLDGYQSRWAGFFAERYLSFFTYQIQQTSNVIYRPVITFD